MPVIEDFSIDLKLLTSRVTVIALLKVRHFVNTELVSDANLRFHILLAVCYKAIRVRSSEHYIRLSCL